MYSKIKADQIPHRDRKQEPRFASTPEWAAMKADIDKGLRAKDALQVALSDADKKKYRIASRKTIFRFVKEYIAATGKPYKVKSFRREDLDFVVVING